MPATATRNQGKTLFVKETLIDHPTANPKFVNEAWKEAGMEGTISETLVNKMRSQLKLTGNLRGTRSSKKGKTSASKVTTSGKPRGRASTVFGACPTSAHPGSVILLYRTIRREPRALIWNSFPSEEPEPLIL